MSTCPTNETFEAKKELKRVLRGYYKSDADPSKPKNFLEKALAKVNATVEAEAAALAGCNVEIIVSAYELFVGIASCRCYFWIRVSCLLSISLRHKGFVRFGQNCFDQQ